MVVSSCRSFAAQACDDPLMQASHSSRTRVRSKEEGAVERQSVCKQKLLFLIFCSRTIRLNTITTRPTPAQRTIAQGSGSKSNPKMTFPIQHPPRPRLTPTFPFRVQEVIGDLAHSSQPCSSILQRCCCCRHSTFPPQLSPTKVVEEEVLTCRNSHR